MAPAASYTNTGDNESAVIKQPAELQKANYSTLNNVSSHKSESQPNSMMNDKYSTYPPTNELRTSLDAT